MNRIGEPEYIGENDVSLAFAPSGPIDAFKCSTDGGTTYDPCKYTKQPNIVHSGLLALLYMVKIIY